jgi:drug/metabolite transporter (DMT)-like permease
MAAFAIADTLVKLSTSLLSTAQIMFILMGGGFVIFTLVAIIQGNRLLDKRAFAPIMLLRYIGEILGMVGMVTALAKVPLSSVGAITQAVPIVVTVGAVIFLNENVGWRRWCSIVAGFIGVLLIVQPGALDFDVSILWAILALLALSVRDLTTRLIPNDIASASLAAYAMAASLPFTIGWIILNGEPLIPNTINWALTIPMIGLGSIGYLLLIASIRTTEVSVVMPYRYSRIIFLLILGIVVFKEKPDAIMLIGASLIVASGVYMMWRENLAIKN